MCNASVDLSHWTKERIDAECGAAYRRYECELIEHYTSYFRQYPQLRCPNHPYSARTITAALPSGHADLKDRIPEGSFHRFCRSARSSQLLALAVFGVALKHDKSFHWFWPAFDLSKRLAGLQNPVVRFEHALAPNDLNEQPRTTKLDVTLATEEAFIVIEGKWSEAGLGICSCAREGEGNPRRGSECARRVYSRTEYWRVAHRQFGLQPMRLSFEPCAISPCYQAVRNVAAAQRLARGRQAGFILLYDARNPYFKSTGAWPGWPAMLDSILRTDPNGRFLFRSLSWQSLIGRLDLPLTVRAWLRDKHCLA